MISKKKYVLDINGLFKGVYLGKSKKKMSENVIYYLI